MLKPFLNHYDTILLDMDGVITVKTFNKVDFIVENRNLEREEKFLALEDKFDAYVASLKAQRKAEPVQTQKKKPAAATKKQTNKTVYERTQTSDLTKTSKQLL